MITMLSLQCDSLIKDFINKKFTQLTTDVLRLLQYDNIDVKRIEKKYAPSKIIN